MHFAYLLLLGLAIVSNFFLVWILYRRTQLVLTTFLFIIFLLFVNIWIVPLFLINILHASHEVFEHLNRFCALGYVFTPVAFFLFSLSYTQRVRQFHSFVFWSVLLIPGITFLYLSWSTNMISIHAYNQAVQYAWGYETPIGVFFQVFLLWFEILMVASMVILVRYYLMQKDKIRKRQTFFVIMAVFIPLLIGTFTNGILPLFDIYVIPLGVLLTSMMSVLIVYAILKYGLFETTPLTILSSIQHAIITVDRSGCILQINTTAEKVLRVKASDILGKPLSNYLLAYRQPKGKINSLPKLLSYVFQRGKTFTSPAYRILNKHLHAYQFVLSITPVYAQENVIGANIFLRDIRRELTRAQHTTDFITMLSHELKTPLAAIKAYNQLLLRQTVTSADTRHHIVEKIDAQVDRVVRLTQDFFELSRMQSGKIKLQREIVRIDEVIDEVIDNMTVTYKGRTLRKEGSSNAVVFADRDRIAQVMINLVSNAIKHSPPGKEIRVKIAADSQKVTISIRDFGRGISPQFHRKIFQKFYQVDAIPLRNIGIGIGLYIASNIVRIHGGKIWVRSSVGKGSTFLFTLPLSK
jgi:signal transduction histidine kinase